MTGSAPAIEIAVATVSPLNAVVIEDDLDDFELVQRALQRGGFDISARIAQNAEQFRRQIGAGLPDVVLADYNVGQWRGMEALQILREQGLDIPLILVSGALGDVNAVECIKQGATDYVLKDNLTRLPISVRRALQEKKMCDERKRAEQDLAKKVEELARSNRDLEQFAYVASHDLQEPLRMVASYTQLLAERYRGKLDENADKYIRYAVEGATRMQTLIQDLLAFSRAGRNGLEFKSVDCNTVVDAAVQNLQAAIAESGATVTRKALPVLHADRSLLQQVFQNLIGNAIKFRGGSPPVISIAAEQQCEEWQFTVKDNGIGIAPEHRDVIFVIFQRLHTRTEYDGNGIGLAICKKIIEQQGGRIWVESQSGQGSTFKFTLPIRKQEDKEQHDHAASLGAAGGRQSGGHRPDQRSVEDEPACAPC